MNALTPPILCLVTDSNQCAGRPLEDVVAQAVHGGVNLVQLREKDLPSGQLYALARRLREVTSGKALLFVNDRVDVAIACGADGVQLGEEGLPLDAARQVSGGRLLLGRSVHSVEGAAQAEANGADLLIVGTIFPTGSHPGAATGGVGLLEQVRKRVSIPFLAIGGVKADNVESVMKAGAAGAAVITAITLSESPAQASREMMSRMKAAWDSMQRKVVGSV
jgi:thiamine-phosphate pyrophosphorylase